MQEEQHRILKKSIKKNTIKMAKQETKKKEAKKFLRSIKFDNLPVAKAGDEVTSIYAKAIAELSKEDQDKYVG